MVTLFFFLGCLCGPVAFDFIDYEDDTDLVDELYDYVFLFNQGRLEIFYFGYGNPRTYRYYILGHPRPLPRTLFDVRRAFYIGDDIDYNPWPPL